MDATRAERRTALLADGEVVWFWRPDADAKLATMLIHRGLRRRQPSPVSGKSAKETVKTIRAGKAGLVRLNLW
jgi:ribosomal protein S13